jgi:1-deoxy-D-xylulose-5-phosphate synthase
MLGPTGLDKFQKAVPRAHNFDVGIAEQHATTSAAGMAYTGLHLVVAVYSTFLNRAFDRIAAGCCLAQGGCDIVLDRAGITGDDGPSHHGIWDLALTGIVPNAACCRATRWRRLCVSY